MKQCNKCVLPGCTPNITFDREGICNYCYTYRKFKYRGEDELLTILDSHRSASMRYDCIVTVSGGRDSTYTLLKLVKDYNMKVLALNYENPFTHPQAKANIENAVSSLGVDIIRFKLKDKIHEKTLKNSLIAWLEEPSPIMVSMICNACRAKNWEILRIAKKQKIRLIVSGGTPFEHASFKKALIRMPIDRGYHQVITKSIRKVLHEIFKNPMYINPVCIPTMVKAYLFSVMNVINPNLSFFNISWIDIFYYIEWNEQKILSRIKSELNWRSPPELNINWRFDCRVWHLKNFMYMKTLGLTELDDFYAKLVREGLITRDEALMRLYKENVHYIDEIQRVINDDGIITKLMDL